MQDYAVYIGLATLVLGVLAYAIKLTRKLSDIEKDIRAEILAAVKDMDAQVDNLQRDVAKLENAGLDRAEAIRRETGEMGNAIRAKIHEMETWNRDTFVRKDSFEAVISRLEKSMEESRKSIEKLGDKIEAKIDRFFSSAKPKPD